MTEDQRNAVASIASGPRGCLFGPFSVLLRSPELLERTQQLGAYLRFRSIVPLHYRELAILITGKFWKSPYVWYVHEPVARSSGLSREIIEFIAKDQRPAIMSDLEAGVYESVNDILNARQISDGNYRKLIAAFGEQGTVELVSIVGYFTMLAMTLNVAGTPVPDDYSGSLGNIHNLGRIDN
ncbi:carboxymuconolactone decarboxylase family protein [Methylorubrum thiocyanatum]|uniref:carboxymuconolactone decarboxylase family protein n=1 Tax=Methylorubrum thiocyanatum TaxID=47958 RepID=UPI003F7EA6A4